QRRAPCGAWQISSAMRLRAVEAAPAFSGSCNAALEGSTSTERNSIMRFDIVPGNVFPDYQLPDHAGTPRKLSELQAEDPLILTLARGHYCPKEHQQHL